MSETTTDNHIMDYEFATIDTPLPPDWDAPAIEFDPDSNQVTIRRDMEIGDPNCREAALESTTYNTQTDTLTVVVYNAKTENHPDNNPAALGCALVMGGDSYRLVVRFSASLPETVVITERLEEAGYVTTQNTTATNPH